MSLKRRDKRYLERNAQRQSIPELAAHLGLSEEEARRELLRLRPGTDPGAQRGELIGRLTFGLLVALVVCAPFVIAPDIHRFSTLAKRAFLETGALLLLLGWLTRVRRPEAPAIQPCALYLPVALLLGWAWTTLAWTLSVHDAVFTLLYWTACAVCFFVALQVLESRRRIEGLLVAIEVTVVAVALIGMAQYLVGLDWFRQSAPPAATLGNRNVASQLMVLGAPVALVLWLRAETVVAAWGHAIAFALMALFLSYTVTRAAWVGVGVETVLFAIWLGFEHSSRRLAVQHPRLKLLAIASAVAIGVLVAVFTAQGVDRPADSSEIEDSAAADASTALFGEGKERNVQVRFLLWANTLELAREHPFGVGVDNLQHYYPAVNARTGIDDVTLFREVNRAHNDYLQVAAELGLPGLALGIWIGVAIILRLLRCLRSEMAARDRGFAVAGGLALAGIGANACFSFPLFVELPLLIGVLYAAIIYRVPCGEVAAALHSESASNRLAPRTASFGLALMLGVLLANVAWQYRLFHADRAAAMMRSAIRSADHARGVTHAARALEWNAFDGRFALYLGQLNVALGRLDVATERLVAYVDRFPYSQTGWYFLGIAHLKAKLYEPAEAALLHAVRFGNASAEAHDALGVLYRRTSRVSEALVSFRRAVEIAPRRLEYRYHLGSAARAAGRFDEALAALEVALVIAPGHASSHRLYGLLLQDEFGRTTEGIEHLEKALAIDPGITGATALRERIEAYRETNPKTPRS